MSNSEIPKDTQDLIKESSKWIHEAISYIIRDTVCLDLNLLKRKLEEKNILGYKKYGEFKFEDNNMYQMAEEEILDAMNYCSYELIKIDRMDLGVNKKSELIDVLGDLILIYDKLSNLKITRTEKLDKHFNS